MKKWDWNYMFIIVAFLCSVVVFQQLPEEMPIHFNSEGIPDDFAPKWVGAFLLPVVIAALYSGMKFIPKIDPKKENYPKFDRSYQLFLTMFMAVMLALHVTLLGYSLGWPIDVSVVVPIGIGLLFIGIGNEMPRFKPNYFIGIRTPWTLANEDVWRKTHRIGGYQFLLSGILFLVSVWFPSPWNLFVPLAFLILSTVYVMYYSYRTHEALTNHS
ncbi:MAG: SdpI family protein [Bacilli bacterium]